MKKTSVLFCTLITTVCGIFTVKADSTLIADWTFQTPSSTNNIIGTGKTPAATQSGILADIGTGTANATHATATTAWSIPAGNGSSSSWSANNWLQNDYYQFQVSTLGFDTINVSYDQIGSSTGPKTFGFQYSIDGTTFLTAGSSYNLVSSPSWNSTTATGSPTESFAFDLSGITSLNNLSAVYFRVVDLSPTTAGAIGGGNVGTTGTDRIDNFLVVSGVPEPSSFALATIGGLGCLFAMRRNKR